MSHTGPPHRPGEDGHAHGEECAELYREWRRYSAVVEDDGGHFTSDERLAAERERAMFARQLAAIGCDARALLALEDAEEGHASDAGAGDEGAEQGA